MEVTAVAQLWANQLNKQPADATGGSFATVLASALMGSSSQSFSATNDTSLVTSLLSTMLSKDNKNDSKDGNTANLMMLCMMGMGSGMSGGGMGVMMSSMAGALSGDTCYAPTYNASGSSVINSQMPALSYGIWNTNLNKDVYVYNPNATVSIPARASIAANPQVTSSAYNRSATLYRQVIDQFDVENNVRYSVKNGSTYCNIFLWDVTRAMGAEIPHYIDPDTLEARYCPDTKGAIQTNANTICNWLGQKGIEYGWREVSAQEAQSLANQGRPVVTAYKNTGGSGHVQVVCPSKDGKYDPKRGVTIAQAGRHLYDYAYITDVYGSKGLSKVKYYAHS